MCKQHNGTPKSHNRVDILTGLANSFKKTNFDYSAQRYTIPFTKEARIEKRRASHSKNRAFFPRQGHGSKSWRGEARHSRKRGQVPRLASNSEDRSKMASSKSLDQEHAANLNSEMSKASYRTPRHYRSQSDGLSVLTRNQTCDCGRESGSCTRRYDLKEAFIVSTSGPRARHPYGSPAIGHLITELQQLSRYPRSEKLSPMPVADPSSRETQMSIERVQKLSTQKNAAVDIDKLVEWHKRKSLQMHNDSTNEETQGVWGGGEYSTETSEGDEGTEGTEVDQNHVIPSANSNEEGPSQTGAPVHYRGIVNLTTTKTKSKKEKRPSRDFVDSFPPWFLHRDSDGTYGTRNSPPARANQSQEDFLSASALADKKRLGNVGKAVTPTTTTPVPKRNESFDLPVQFPVQDAATVNHRPLDQALYGVKQFLAHHDPLNIVHPSSAPRRRGYQDQSDTQAPNHEFQNWAQADVSGFVANRADSRGEAHYDNINAIPNDLQMPVNEVSATQPSILRRISNSYRSPKTGETPAHFSSLVQSRLNGLTLFGSSHDLPPQNCSKEALPVPPDLNSKAPSNILTRPHPQPRSGVRAPGQDLFSKHPSHFTSMSKLSPKGSTTTLDAIEAALPQRSTTVSPNNGQHMPSVVAKFDGNGTRSHRPHRMFAHPPTSPPPCGPLPAIPQLDKSISKKALLNPTSRSGKEKDDSKSLLRTSDPLYDQPSSDSSASRLSSTSRSKEITPLGSSMKSTRSLKDRSRPSNTRAQTASSTSEGIDQSLNQSRSAVSNSSTILQRTVSMSSLESSFSDRSKRWAGRPRKDLKMRHLNSARARAENERLEQDGGERSVAKTAPASKPPMENNNQTLQHDTGAASSQAEKDALELRSTAVPIQVALQGHGRNNSPHRPQKTTDPTMSRPVKRRTSFLGNLGSQELILLSKVTTSPPRSSSAQETRSDHFRGDSTQSEDAGHRDNRASSLLSQPIATDNLPVQSDMTSSIPRPSAIRTSSASSLQTVARTPGNTTTGQALDTTIPSHAHPPPGNPVYIHSSPSTYSAPSTMPSSFSSSNDSSRLSLLEARCADLEVQLLRHRAWTYAMLFPAQVLQAANPADLAIAQNAMPQGLGVWTPPPSAAPQDRDGNVRSVLTGRGEGLPNAMYTPRASDESYRSAATDLSGNASAAFATTEDEGNSKEPKQHSPTTMTATRHRLRNAHSSWTLFGNSAVVGDDRKKKRESSSTSNSNRTSSDPYYSDSRTTSMNTRGSFDRILDRFPRREEAAVGGCE